jgi:SAM-dependent methyltransferase
VIQSLAVPATASVGTIERGQSARAAYDVLAFAYDAFTAEFAHERWIGELERLAREHGLAGDRVLDVACGTGKSFLPLLERGYRVTGCDISPAMLEIAAAKVPQARLLEADMRLLPDVGRFDLVTCVDDALNYVHGEREVVETLRGIRRSLAPDGVVLWDVNTLAMYRSDFASNWAIERDGLFIVWSGRVGAQFCAGERASAVIDVFSADGDGRWRRHRSEHVQRHWPAVVLRRLAAEAGLTVVAVHGQHRGAQLEPALDELVHRKAVFVAWRDDRPTGREVSAMRIGSP